MIFSFIVPVYKVEPYLARCIESLIHQTFEDIEIILVDDGSPDNCPAICDRYSNLDSRITVIHKVNGGLSDARNVGMTAAKGKYIVFVDSDDYVSVNMCEELLPFVTMGCDIIVGDAVVENGACDLLHVMTVERVFTGEEYLLAVHRSGHATMVAWLNVYSRDFLNRNGLRFKYGILHEDEEFTPRAFLAAATVVYSRVFFYHYVIRSNSITVRKDYTKNAADLFSTCCELKQLFEPLENYELKSYLQNSLVEKYLNIFQVGRLYQHGPEWIHKRFVKENAHQKRTKMKAALFSLSPQLYFFFNSTYKRLKKGSKSVITE